MDQLYSSLTNNWVLIPIIIWTMIWKGFALWIAVKNNQGKWFLALLILNTFGILEIIYIFFVAKKKWSDIKEILSGKTSPKEE